MPQFTPKEAVNAGKTALDAVIAQQQQSLENLKLLRAGIDGLLREHATMSQRIIEHETKHPDLKVPEQPNKPNKPTALPAVPLQSGE